MKSIKLFITILLLISSVSININGAGKVEFKHDEENKKVDVFINSKYFTSYIYIDNMEKQVLFPIHTISGKDITRGYPLNPRPFERVDHPHHIGLWFNFGDVNGLDFWNNYHTIKPENKHKYGSIKFDEIVLMDQEKGELVTDANWIDSEGKILLKERTTFIFSEIDGVRFIERISSLTAKQNEVVFTENKEGMLGLRVDRAFEEPSEKPVNLLDSEGKPTDTPILNNEGLNGVYRNAEGVTGSDVWGKKSKWVALSANKEGEIITIALIDHIDNPYYPAWSHARGYGLFATNNLAGKSVDSKSPNIGIELSKGDNITFRHKVVIGGNLTNKQLEEISKSTYNSLN